jgi:predicted amidohydrolase YtcJ
MHQKVSSPRTPGRTVGHLELAWIVISFLLSLFGWGPGRVSAQQPGEPADFAFINGKVYTEDAKRPWAEAVAVKGKVITCVGSSAEVQKCAGPNTRVIDLGGRMLMPGFVDGHNHFVAGAAPKRGVKLNGCKDKEEMLQRIRNYVKANPNREMYSGYGWQFGMFGGKKGTRQELDAICQEKPILLLNEDTHNAWFNTKAMEKCGITKSTPDPRPGLSFFEREPDGTPSGIGIEAESWLPMAIAIGFIGGKTMLQDVMEEVFPMLPKAGITAYHEMGIMAPELTEGYLGYQLLLEWEKQGKLPCRVVGVHGWRDPKISPGPVIETLKQWSEKYHSELVQVTGLKIWSDGTFNTRTGVLLEPYADKPDTKGESEWTAEVLARWIEAAYLAGFDVHIHTIGDGSLRRCLDAFEAVEKKLGPMGRRSALHHVDIIHPDDLPRFKSLGIGGNATLEWMVTYWDDALKFLGKERTEKENDIWKRLIDMGVCVSFGSDLPGTDPDELSPLYQMQAALTGRLPGSTAEVKRTADRVPSLEQLLRGYTINGAYQMRMEDKIGSIEAGKLADLIILEKNLFDVPPDQLTGVRVLLTMMNGKIIHREEGW